MTNNYLNPNKSIENRFDGVADALASEGYVIIDNFLSSEEVELLLSVLKHYIESDRLKKAGIGTAYQYQVNREVRGDYIKWVEPSQALPPTQTFIDYLKDLIAYLNRTCFLGLKDFEVHYTMYPKGTYYDKHIDRFKLNDARVISMVTYLNKDWKEGDGGELILYPEDKPAISIQPTSGRMICFRSDSIEHEVLTTNTERYSITGWLLNQISELTFINQ